MDKSVYQRPRKPTRLAVTKRGEVPSQAFPEMPEIIKIDKFSECHVTPPDVARRMVEYLGKSGDYLTLEPSAGTGNLLQALLDSGHSHNELVAIERHVNLCAEIRKRFSGQKYIEPLCECFLEYAERAKGKIEYPRIILNPPFLKIRQHMKAALSLLGKAGHDKAVLVALVPITYQNDDAKTLEELPRKTFSATNISTKIIYFEIT